MAKRKRPSRPHKTAKHSSEKRRSASSSGFTDGGKIWLYGNHAVMAALGNPRRPKFRLLVNKNWRDGTAVFAEAGDLTIQPEIIDQQEMEKILPPGAVHQGLALQTASLPAAELEDLFALQDEDSAVVVMLDQVTDPRNMGAIMRSAAAFGAAALIVPDRHSPEATAVLAKAASGALDRLPLIRVNNLSRALDQLKDYGFWMIGLDGTGEKTLEETDLGGKTALILGAEGKGLRRLTAEKCDFLIRIPIDAQAGSLNVSAAAAIALYEIARKPGWSA
ncbi:MAG: 23S rRNA (guanosine(2251)-2'-O)-methyltransferase RlmB [Rhodospirillales bacterium]|jgi:23S rRNA (guanosine2251-2'-O)-methyltransferase|nr:23S rRNA (guanosine(2251)-2'-O)-methyltransferase RlmB [Rhodospirillales bacterium]